MYRERCRERERERERDCEIIWINSILINSILRANVAFSHRPTSAYFEIEILRITARRELKPISPLRFSRLVSSHIHRIIYYVTVPGTFSAGRAGELSKWESSPARSHTRGSTVKVRKLRFPVLGFTRMHVAEREERIICLRVLVDVSYAGNSLSLSLSFSLSLFLCRSDEAQRARRKYWRRENMSENLI